jgi:folate-binding protein YgfZ
MQSDWATTLRTSGAHMAEGEVAHFGDPLRETRAAAEGDVCADLSHLGLIRAEGADTESFLQGQLSNDVRLVTDGRSQLSAYCNPKGRMLAIMRLFKRDDAYFLQLPLALLEPTLKRLSMFVLRAKVKLQAEPALVGIGLSGPSAAAHLEKILGPCKLEVDASRTHNGITVIRLPGRTPRYMLLGSVAGLQPVWRQLTGNVTPVGAHAWRWLDIQAGLPTILPGTVEEFVPQMANLELVGGVNFKKGCYPGQEIVARMHYLGRLKQRMIGAHVQSAARPLPGTPVYAADFPGQSAGKVVDAQPAPSGGYDLLAVVQTSSIEKADIHLDDPQGVALQLTALPYPLPQA